MTNLQTPPSGVQRLITPGRVLVGAPIAVGLLLAGLLVSLEVVPQWNLLRQRGARLRELREMETQLPMLERQVVVSQKALAEAREQKSELLSVIAGIGDIRTFLAQLSSEAARTGVQLALYEPLAAPAGEAAEEDAAQEQGGDGEEPAPPPADPLAPEGYERRSVLLRAWADGPELLEFLRSLERLSLLVVQSDLTLEALTASEANQRLGREEDGITELKLLLSFYDEAADARSQVPAPEAEQEGDDDAGGEAGDEGEAAPDAPPEAAPEGGDGAEPQGDAPAPGDASREV